MFTNIFLRTFLIFAHLMMSHRVQARRIRIDYNLITYWMKKMDLTPNME